MPIYEYQCLKCGKTTEVMQKFSDKPLSKCQECGGKMKKLISNTTFVLKGTGWYVTDYAKKDSGSEKGRAGKKSSEEKVENKKDNKSETKSENKSEPKAETKSETKSEGKSESAAAK